MDVDDDKDGVPDATNVLKLFHLLKGDTSIDSRRLKDESEKSLVEAGVTRQVAKYLHGVGDSSNPLLKLLGGAFGAGTITRIVRGYTFISRNWEPGDDIFIIGFSRGAYTARALAGLIASVGLLDPKKNDLHDKDLAYSLGVAAWRQYREKAGAKQTQRSIKDLFASFIANLPGYARIPLPPESLVKARIKAVAVWDTVGALGIPTQNAEGSAIDVFRFADDILSDDVDHGIHAVSVDERRSSFQPTLWQTRKGMKQYLFPGAHADVGGGYPEQESELSNIALQWMIEEVRALDVLIKPFPNEWKIREDAEIHKPWTQGIFAALGNEERTWKKIYALEKHSSIDIRRQRRKEPPFTIVWHT